MPKCNFCSSSKGITRYTVQGIEKKGREMVFINRRKINACRFCYEKIEGVWISCARGLRRGKNFMKEITKLKGFGSKKCIDSYIIMQARSERRERRGIITP